MDFLGTPIGFIMDIVYGLVNNYGVTIIILSILVKLLMLPLTIKQQKSMTGMQQIQPLMAQVQKKYENDKEKQSQEMMKLYKEYNISPFAGCLPILIQFPILIGLYGAVAKPLSFMLRIGSEQIQALADLVGVVTAGSNAYSYQLSVAKLASLPEFLDRAVEIASNFMKLDFSFLGLDLSMTPSFSTPHIIWILPILSAGFTFLSTFIMQPKQKDKDKQQGPDIQGSMKFMTYLMPLFILWIGFSVPAGVSLYWAVNGVIQIIQYFTLDKKLKANLMAELAVKNASIEAKKTKKKRG